jgi:serine/threonine protein kinase
MSPERWHQIENLFLAALEHPASDRDVFLDETCESDAELRCRVDALLASDERADRFIEAPALAMAAGLIQDDGFPSKEAGRLGPYKLVRELGEGGMGSVYLAVRADDQYEKEVAIKVVKRGLDADDIRRRFRHERQILAGLDHPNIARLIDGGATEDGRPYLVMDYVEGVPITAYCDDHQLSTEQRLKLFQLVCSAVAYAHRNLVIHREIKPSNILITEDSVPKLLDFGIAKLLDAGAADRDEQTATVARIMTPQYASPEQVRGSSVTTASDIYSLGVLLYKILTGHHPYQFKTLFPAEVERIICEKEPERPSSAITRIEDSADASGRAAARITPESVSEARNEHPNGLRRKLEGDLDNIVLMAMRKEPERRYPSVEHFSEDVRRHLEGLPVLATHDSFRYRAGKFVRRNRLGVAAAAIIMLFLVGGIVATAWQARAARREKANAETVSAFLEQVLNYSNPVLNLSRNNSRETPMAEALDAAAKRLEGDEFGDQPEVRAELERIIAKSYDYQGRYDLAIAHWKEYVAIQSGLNRGNHPKTLAASAIWAGLLFAKGDMEESEKIFRRVLPLMRTEQQKGNIKAEILAEALNSFGYLRRTQGASKEAEALFRETLALGPQIPDQSRFIIGVTQSTLASTLADQGRFDEALETARESVAASRERGETSRPDFGFSLTILGGFVVDKGDFEEADRSLHEAEVIYRKLLLPSHLWLGDNLRNQADSFYRQNRFAEAQDRVTETLKIYREGFGTHYDQYPTVLITQGLILNKTGRPREGEAILREAVKLRTDSLPAGHYWIALALSALGEC